ncbi:MAG TPA: hypothetical protein VES79_05335 [Solirubrobacteraceae bacterium]|nr:hypothetical protein [Solirubrobacteraceae bacterium]
MPNFNRRGFSMQTLQHYVAAAQLTDRLTAADTSRAVRRVFHERRATPIQSVAAASGERLVLRRAVPHDGAALARLAELDGASRPAGEMLLAEVDEQIAAAVPLDGGRAIADPFRPTAELVELLRMRARLLAGGGVTAGRLQRLRPRLRHLRAAA